MKRPLRAPFCIVVATTIGCAGAQQSKPRTGGPVCAESSVVPTPIPVPPGDRDADHDGILDQDDRCPNDPEDKDGFEDADGCPDPDNDKDGILDANDKCPNEAETYNGLDDADGCPDSKVVIITSNPPVVEMVMFEAGSTSPRKEATPILDAVVAVMKAHPEITLVQLEGHADEPGKPDALLKLSQTRADNVRKWLIDHGIEASRLRAKGFGTYCPFDPKDKARNRRVQFKVAKTTGGTTSPDFGCAAATSAGVVSDPIP